MTALRIGIDARFYGPVGKGLGRYTTELIRSLEELDSENEYRIFLRRENFESYRPKNRNFRKVLADFGWYSIEEQILFPSTLYKESCDIVHFPHFNVPLRYRKPFIVTVHDLILLRFPTLRATTLSPIAYWMKFLAYRLVIWSAIRNSRLLITVSEYAKSDILSWYHIPSEKVVVTYEAAHPFCFYWSESKQLSFFSRLDLVEEPPNDERRGILRPYILSVGNAYPHKNLESLIDAFVAFPDARARLVFVGWDEYFYPRLEKYARSRNISSVIFAKAVTDEELDALYRHARVSVFPSRYEGFGLPPLEAMGKGSPVIASHGTAFPEILGSAARFFDPDDPHALREAIIQVWEDESFRGQLQALGYERSFHFSWDRMGRETLHLYRYVLGLESKL